MKRFFDALPLWKACEVDSVYSFPIKRCPQIKKVVFALVKLMVEWTLDDRLDENNRLLEGGEYSSFRAVTGMTRQLSPHHLPPDNTKMVTLAIHKRL